MGNQLQNIPATSIVALFETDKEQRKSFVEQIITSIEDGNINPLNVHLQLKAMEDIISTIKENDVYISAVLNEAEKEGKKEFNYHNSKIRIGEVGTKYDYSKSNDIEIIELKSKENDIKGKIKERENYLKNIPTDGIDVVNEITGEVSKMYPPSKSSKTTVIVTLL